MQEIDVERALKALDGNVDLIKELAGMFVEDAPVLLEELKKAVHDDDAKEAVAIVHSLKGLIATYFARTGVDIAQRLENPASADVFESSYSEDIVRLEESIRCLIRDFEALGWVIRQ